MPDRPLAYFITFSTYGTWLHGDAPGSVDRGHNRFGTPWVEPDADRRADAHHRMSQEPYRLDAGRRAVVRDAVVDECRFRGWPLLAAHVRSNHVHLVVTADREPEFVMRACKATASRRLNEAGYDHPDRKRWTTHGSTKYLWREDAVAADVEYTLHRQGEPMAVFPDPSADGRSPSASEG
ncbi:MAG: hypothetical protein C0501_13540 [Isosphaera sp.]|nr:hypothetical protein [Isosphaera sp.]